MMVGEQNNKTGKENSSEDWNINLHVMFLKPRKFYIPLIYKRGEEKKLESEPKGYKIITHDQIFANEIWSYYNAKDKDVEYYPQLSFLN